jgi:hypothetical protein
MTYKYYIFNHEYTNYMMGHKVDNLGNFIPYRSWDQVKEAIAKSNVKEVIIQQIKDNSASCFQGTKEDGKVFIQPQQKQLLYR